MHRSHLHLCGVGLVLALGYLLLTGGSAGGVALLIAALVCPLAMILALSVLVGGAHRHQPDRSTSVDETAPRVDHR